MTFALTITTAEDIAAAKIAEAREAAVITRHAFCMALVDAQILSLPDAVAASKGEWPTSLADFLQYLDERQAADAMIEWATAAMVHRNNPLVLTLASWIGLPDEQVDAMFGIKPG